MSTIVSQQTMFHMVTKGPRVQPNTGQEREEEQAVFWATLYQPYGNYKIVRIKGRKSIGKAQDSASPPFER